MKVTSKGQVTIPARIREYLGISPHAEVDFQVQDGRVVLVKTPETGRRAADKFAAVRGTLKTPLSTGEWMQATRSD